VHRHGGEVVTAVNLDQILRLAGPLADVPGEARDRFRAYLKEAVTSAAALREHIDSALAAGDEQHRRALQDLVNHGGRLIGFDVESGPYQGETPAAEAGLWDLQGRLTVAVQLVFAPGRFSPTVLDGALARLVLAGRVRAAGESVGLVVTPPDPAVVEAVAHALGPLDPADRLRVASTDALCSMASVVETLRPAAGEIVRLFWTPGRTLGGAESEARRAGARPLPRLSRRLVIVTRERPGLFEHTRRELADTRTEVILDRRVAQRRDAYTPRVLERRRRDRRARPDVEAQIRRLGYGIVNLESAAPGRR
jgi:hypothetical protein